MHSAEKGVLGEMTFAEIVGRTSLLVSDTFSETTNHNPQTAIVINHRGQRKASNILLAGAGPENSVTAFPETGLPASPALLTGSPSRKA